MKAIHNRAHIITLSVIAVINEVKEQFESDTQHYIIDHFIDYAVINEDKEQFTRYVFVYKRYS